MMSSPTTKCTPNFSGSSSFTTLPADIIRAGNETNISMNTQSKTIGIVGGGVIGLCSAYYLQQAGYEVTVFDAGDLSDNCSHGNAGYVSPSHFVPLSSPGIVSKGLRWMLSKTSPFYIEPRLDSKLMYWGWQFYKHSTAKHVAYAMVPLKDINLLSRKLYLDLNHELNFDFELNSKGCLALCKTARGFEHECELAEQAHAIGVEATVVRPNDLHQYISGTATAAAGGVFFPQDMHMEPSTFVKGLKKTLDEKGVKFLLNAPVKFTKNASGNVAAIVSNQQTFLFDEYLLAAGSRSGELAAGLQLRIPLKGGKGYSFTKPNQQKIFEVPVILVEGRVAISPLQQHTRYGGTMQIDGNERSISYHRVQGIANTVNQYFPELQLEPPPIEKVWYGFRPCSPDGLPYIGRIPKIGNLTVATGHAMMGLSLAPATGKLVTEIISGNNTSMDIKAFDPVRYA